MTLAHTLPGRLPNEPVQAPPVAQPRPGVSTPPTTGAIVRPERGGVTPG